LLLFINQIFPNNKIIFDEIAKKVLTKEQQSLHPLLTEFSKTHFLVGGTAIALILGHRKSIDFDFFHLGHQGTGKELAARISSTGFTLEAGSDLHFLSDEEESEATLIIQGVKIQLIDFNRNPYNIPINLVSNNILCKGIKTLSLEDLACLKIFAMMYRRKWKDAVDIFYILNKIPQLTFSHLIQRTKQIFTTLYQEIASLETILQDNWDMTEGIEYVTDEIVEDKIIRQKLIELAKYELHS
jgi:hypothetical protein